MITPQNAAKKLATVLGLHVDLYLKREDLHPYRSHKGRSISLMIEKYVQDGCQNFCISSSGNAALAAAMFTKDYNKNHNSTPLSLKIFVSMHIPTYKLEPLKQLSIEDPRIIIEQVQTPKRTAFQLDKKGSYRNLRQSTDDTALIGYQSLAEELAQIPNLSAVFIPTSSGTTAQGLHLGFKKLGLNPQIHIVQTPKCHPLVDNSPIGTSTANAIVDTIGYRKEAIQRVLTESRGAGWIATDEDIGQVRLELIFDNKIQDEGRPLELSPNSALSIAALQLAIKNHWKFSGPVVCLITGR